MEVQVVDGDPEWCGSGVFGAWKGFLGVVGSFARLRHRVQRALMQCRICVLSAEAEVGSSPKSRGDLSQNQGRHVSCVAGLHLAGTSVV